MLKNINEENILVEKYRPNNIDDLILEDSTKKVIKSILDKNIGSEKAGLPHLILEGKSGLGKTSLALVLCSNLGLEHLFINASQDLNVDVLKQDVKHFAETMSTYEFDNDGKMLKKKKVVILDEIDGISKSSNAVKNLKAFIEMYSNNCTFIFTCNNFETVTNDTDVKQALKSRCQYINFNIKNIKPYYGLIMKRLVQICEKENIKYTKENIVEIIKYYKTDIRSMINFIDQHYFELDRKDLVYAFTKGVIDDLMNNVKNCNFANIREFIVNTDINLSTIFTSVYRNLKEYIEPKDIPTAILIINAYMNQYPNSIDPEITITAFLLDFSKNVKFKNNGKNN